LNENIAATSAVWQEAFALAWEAFCRGNVPVGCVIADGQGRIAAKGRNAIYDDESITPLAGTNLAHAEIVALSQLKRGEHETGEYTLYTTLEPCPMCFGAIVMTGIRKVCYAARDGLAGSAVLTGATPYIASKQISVALEGSSLEVFQIALTTAFELRRQHPRQEVILSCLSADCPEGVALGTRLFQEGFFSTACRLVVLSQEGDAEKVR
jgi:tRNA(adenine34) deaminase